MTPDSAVHPPCSKTALTVRVNERRLFMLLSATIVVHVALGVWADCWPLVTEAKLPALLSRFDMDEENTITAWFSSMVLAACSIVLAIIFTNKFKSRDRFTIHWGLLSLAFLYLSMDEAAALHELLSLRVAEMIDAQGVYYFPWVLIATPAVFAFFLAYLRFLWNLPVKTRILFIAAGALYVGGALGMEMIGGAFAERFGYFDWRYSAVMLVEETCEMFGASLFLFSLINYVGSLDAGRKDTAEVGSWETGAGVYESQSV